MAVVAAAARYGVVVVVVEPLRQLWPARAERLYTAATAALGFMDRVLRQAVLRRVVLAGRWVIQAQVKVVLVPVAN